MQQRVDVSEKISVVMITRDRSESVVRTLGELRALSEDFPIIVVDNQSSDDTVTRIQTEFPEVRLIQAGENDGALARNLGVEAAATPYIAFCDDDSWWEDGSLARAVKYFDRYPKLGALTGPILVNEERKLDLTSAFQEVSRLPSRFEIPGIPVLSFLGCALMVRVEAYRQAGGYSRHLYFSGEEELLAYDIAANGWAMAYCQDLVVRHFPSPQRDLARRYRLGSRNWIIRAWLRRPFWSALRKTLQVEIHRPGWQYDLLGFIEGLRSIPEIWPDRRVVPAWLERQIRMLEKQESELLSKALARQRGEMELPEGSVVNDDLNLAERRSWLGAQGGKWVVGALLFSLPVIAFSLISNRSDKVG